MKFLISILIVLFTSIGFAQTKQFQVVVSPGLGASLGMTSLKTGLNIGLKEAGLNKATGSLIINANADVGVTDRFSVGLAYTNNGFDWRDDFKKAGPNDTLVATPDTIIVNAGVKIRRNNIGIRGLFHVGAGESDQHDIYGGARLGFTIWSTEIEGEVEGLPASGFKFPASLPSFQVLVGYRYYFTPYTAINAELAVGSAPYFANIGLSFAVPGNN